MAPPVVEVAPVVEGKKVGRVKWVKHYSSSQSILIVGDGDLSFSRALATAFGSGDCIVATSLDSYSDLIGMYSQAESNVKELKRMGATVLHGVDVKNTKKHVDLKFTRFERIIFNLPHAGFIGEETQAHMISAHQVLVRRFFRNASHLLHPDGEIHVSHKTGERYNRWEIEELASEFSLVMFKSLVFRKEDYPGYNQKRGDGERCDQEFPLRNGCTFMFSLTPSVFSLVL
ncbi:heavy metal-associated isoprenylated plant protein 41-like [Triticum aestivum]|uniref:heavy metal-associated isoprenylated plant protein 41-like n=1 Tax=Triticum aestivum TaxID=4565 RepID=UPI001D020590|nr:heavy metal-associated isoprenylated plant protein 41-like [Triticum aestivum]